MSATDQAAKAEAQPLSASYVNGALWLLLVIYTLNFLDRQIVNILAEPIKKDLALSDTQLGLLTGLAFAVVYTVLGIPIARYADRFSANRVQVISVALAVWSGFTALCGLASNFTQLLLARIGVGIGEAGCTPAAHSLIVDYVDPARRARALAFYSLGVPIGTLLGYSFGGVVAEHLGWKSAFLLVGAPGLLLAVVTWFVMKEPRRLGLVSPPAVDHKPLGFSEALKILAGRKSYWYACLGASVISFLGYGHAAFLGGFYARVHEMPIGQIGIALGMVLGLSGIVGTFIGGQIADRAARKDTRAYFTVPAIAMLCSVPFFVAGMLADTALHSLLLLSIPTALNSLWYGPIYAVVQGVAGPQLRATAVAIMLFIVNMIGLGLGPLALGVLSDHLATTQGLGAAEGLRWALLLSASIGLVTVLLFLLGRQTIRADIAAANS
ncbi:MAG: spinster family MFS transporter [Caulobacterales bacterium]|jgi:predicted MFS family arabinose efflux permease